MFERIIIRTVNQAGWPIDFELKSGQQAGPALKWLEEHGYEPAGAPAATAVAQNGATTGSFAAEQLVATVDDGEAFWKVKGGAYGRWGVRIWPEVLQAAGFDPDQLNPLKPISLAGYTAHFSVKENGQPRKIIQLVKEA